MAGRLIHQVRSVGWGDASGFADGTLRLRRADLVELVAACELADVSVSCVPAGEPTRIINVLDVIEPRATIHDHAGVFPGTLSPIGVPTGADVHVARGLLVVTAGEIPRAQEAILDLGGPMADYTPFGGHHALVVEFTPAENASWEAVGTAVRQGGLRLAERLGQLVAHAPVDARQPILGTTPPTASTGRPRVGVITNLQAQGAFKDTYVYGHSAAELLPTILEPIEFEHGAVVSGQYGHPGLRNATFIYQNHPVLAALARRGPGDAEFGGVIVCPEPDEWAAKQLVSHAAVRLARACGLDTVIVAKEGGGNADADLVLKADGLADAGIHVVGIAPESAGKDGSGPPLVTTPRTAQVFISAGNYDEAVQLPAMERVLGGSRFGSLDGAPAGPLEVPLAMLCCALNPLGGSRVTCREGG